MTGTSCGNSEAFPVAFKHDPLPFKPRYPQADDGRKLKCFRSFVNGDIIFAGADCLHKTFTKIAVMVHVFVEIFICLLSGCCHGGNSRYINRSRPKSFFMRGSRVIGLPIEPGMNKNCANSFWAVKFMSG